MKIYLASRYSRHAEMQGVRAVLETFNHKIISRWIDYDPKITPNIRDIIGNFTESFSQDFLNTNFADCAPLSQHDLEDILNSDCVISFTGSGGKSDRHVEFGYALALGKRLILVGPRENVFHTMPAVEYHPSWKHFVVNSDICKY